MNKKAEEILDQAKRYVKKLSERGENPNWSDYNYFKNLLIDSGCYGYEGKLASIFSL